MQKILPVLALILCFLTQACNSNSDKKPNNEIEKINKQAPFYTNQLPVGSPRISKVYDSTKIEKYDPFIIYKDGSYMIAAEIEDADLFDRYNPIFERNQYSGNGYSWEGIIKQMLQKNNPALIEHLKFDPESGGFYVFADSEKTQREFAGFISNMFKDISKLEQYLKTADREMIDD